MDFTDAELLRIARDYVVEQKWEFGESWDGVSAGDFLMATNDDGYLERALSLIISQERERLSVMGFRLRGMVSDFAPQWLLDNHRDALEELAHEIARDKLEDQAYRVAEQRLLDSE